MNSAGEEFLHEAFDLSVTDTRDQLGDRAQVVELRNIASAGDFFWDCAAVSTNCHSQLLKSIRVMCD